MAALTAGAAAPDFTLAGTNGESHNLQEALARGPLLAVFFKVSCPTCQFTLPFVERLFQQFKSQGAQVWAVSQDDPEDSRRFAERFGISFPVVVDPKPYRVSRSYGLRFVPTMFLIGSEGEIQLTADGFSRPDLLEIQKRFGSHFSATAPPLFQPGEKIPEYKPG
jgi:peroxiredoxin